MESSRLQTRPLVALPAAVALLWSGVNLRRRRGFCWEAWAVRRSVTAPTSTETYLPSPFDRHMGLGEET